MSISHLEPLEACDLLRSVPDAVYLDVRTENEFAQGHPEGAVNVPVVYFLGPGRVTLNEEFLDVVEKCFAKNQTIVVGCLAGPRSERACQLMAEAGFTNLVNMRGGFGGARGPSGEVIVKGWCDCGLPVSAEPGERSYAALRRKAGV